MKPTSITIIGMGPRGLSILERIAAFATAAAARGALAPLQLNLIDPGDCGPGVHSARQPQHLLINTVASQVTIFPFHEAVELAPVCATPSLTEWARLQGYRRFGEQFFQVGTGEAGGAEVGESDYLPRQLLGRYLGWAYRELARALPASVTLTHLRQRAIDMFEMPDGSFTVELDSGYALASDFVFLTTGHSRNSLTDEEAWCRKFALDHARYNHRLAYIRHVYPLDKLGSIAADAKVGIQGIGLTAHDVVAELTVGRGGRFEGEGGHTRYLRSGQEPQLLLFSRNCIPAAARGINQKGLSGRHQPRFFTREAVCALRAQALQVRGAPQLDFDRELLPLMLKEMAYAWRWAQDGVAPEPDSYVAREEEHSAIETLLFPQRGRSYDDAAAFAAGFRARLEVDLHEARRGNQASPAKAAADVLRDVRAVLQDAIEHGSLLPASHRKFLSVYNPAINRLTFGPPRLRNEQLLALIDAGVMTVGAGPNPVLRVDEERSQFSLHVRFPTGPVVQYLDALVVARLDVFSPEGDDTALIQNLLHRGIIRPYYNGNFHPGGLDIDSANHPLGRGGRPHGALWALGYLVEGAHYYTHALPRPQLHSRQAADAERCVRALFEAIAARQTDIQVQPHSNLVSKNATM
ncbi:MAG: FAD/NAD(P)-binding protein [Pseudomonadota bacterium]